MPNWCENEVEISGSKEDIKKFIKLVTGKFDFNRIIPMPEQLKKAKCPTNIISQEEYDEQQKRIQEATGKEKEYLDRVGIGITQEMSDCFKKEYGYDNWYDWVMANWGVKWNTDPTNVSFDSGETWASWEFMSPWNPPEHICYKLRELFPNVSICWFYKEPGMQISGWL